MLTYRLPDGSTVDVPSPGVGIQDGKVIFLCPGCGLEAMGQPVTEETVYAWFLAVIDGLVGGRCRTPSKLTIARANDLTRSYMEHPWHE